MAGIEWESEDVKRLAIDLRGAPLRVQLGAARQLNGPVGRLVAREMRKDAAGHRGNWFGKPGTSFDTGLERHVSHEMVDPFELEAGIENKGAGKLGHIIAYGSVNNGPAYDPGAGPRRAMPRVVEMLADMSEDSVLGEES